MTSDLGRKDGAPELRPRIRVIYLLVLVAFLGLMARLIVLQVIHGERYSYLSENNRIRIKRILGTRGMIYDRRGDLLVDSRPSFDLLFVPEDSENPEATLKQLARYLGREENELVATFKQSKS